MRRHIGFCLLTILALAAGVALWQRTQITAWYLVNGLVASSEAERETWAAGVADFEPAVPWLVSRLASDDAGVCSNLAVALVHLAQRWPSDDPRCANLVDELRTRFASFSTTGKEAALRFPIEIFRKTNQAITSRLTLGVGKLLAAAAPDGALDPANSLVLASQLIERVPQGQWLDTCRQAALRGLQHVRADNRIRAIHLALQAVFSADQVLLGSIAPLLRDTDAKVRRAALVAVGMSRDAAAEEELLPLLHDPDQEVRRLCEVALRSRGLQDEQLLLARLISDARPIARLEVFNHLYGAGSVEPGVWLRRLSHDASPAIRSAAIRTAVTQRRPELRDRIRQMARDDPSPTVRQLAAHYLGRLE